MHKYYALDSGLTKCLTGIYKQTEQRNEIGPPHQNKEMALPFSEVHCKNVVTLPPPPPPPCYPVKNNIISPSNYPECLHAQPYAGFCLGGCEHWKNEHLGGIWGYVSPGNFEKSSC